MTIEEQLFSEGYCFDFFQAVRLLERLDRLRRPVERQDRPRRPVGGPGSLQEEPMRFHAHLSLAFPPSAIYEIEPPRGTPAIPHMTVTFMGLTGPSGILPRHYTDILLRIEAEMKGPEKRAMRRLARHLQSPLHLAALSGLGKVSLLYPL